GLDALERRLLAEVVIRKADSGDRRPDVRTFLPIAIPSRRQNLLMILRSRVLQWRTKTMNTNVIAIRTSRLTNLGSKVHRSLRRKGLPHAENPLLPPREGG